MYDYVIVGAGFAGSVLAERIANQLNKKVLVIEKRNHIGGNAYDCYDKDGILIHKYGPHIFHTRSKAVWEYLSKFTEWFLYHHKVLGVIDGQETPIPFNINTLHQVFPDNIANKLEEKLVTNFGFNKKVPILKLREIEDVDLRDLANYVYEKIFLNYTQKQWGVSPEDLDPTVTGRVPVYISKDNRYFQDPFQGMPKDGYTKLFERMLDNRNIKILLNTDYKEVIDVNFSTGDIHLFGNYFEGKLIYSGPVDYFFDYEYGKLPYRSLDFKFRNYSTEKVQEVGTVNYPNDYDFTRITEFKYLTGQEAKTTTLVEEYSQDYVEGVNLPYYPIKNDENFKIYDLYREAKNNLANVIFVGRLAEYQYYDMDAVIAKALKVFEERIKQ